MLNILSIYLFFDVIFLFCIFFVSGEYSFVDWWINIYKKIFLMQYSMDEVSIWTLSSVAWESIQGDAILHVIRVTTYSWVKFHK